MTAPDTDTLAGLLAGCTPGLWMIRKWSRKMTITGNIHQVCGGDFPAAFVPAWDMPEPGEVDGTDEAKANARLIALAPELARTVLEQQATLEAQAAEIARLTAALAESEAAAEGALMIIVQAQAERDAALARETALLASNQTNRDLLYQLTGAQSEVTHLRKRFDTAVATARAEGRKEGLRDAAEIADAKDPDKPTNYLHRRENIPAAILAAAEKGE